MTGKVLCLPPAPVQHGGQSVIQGVEGGDVITLPTGIPQGTAPADPVCRAVEDNSGIVVVGNSFVNMESPAVSISGSADVDVRDNRYQRTDAWR